jgi:hypothetical protein
MQPNVAEPLYMLRSGPVGWCTAQGCATRPRRRCERLPCAMAHEHAATGTPARRAASDESHDISWVGRMRVWPRGAHLGNLPHLPTRNWRRDSVPKRSATRDQTCTFAMRLTRGAGGVASWRRPRLGVFWHRFLHSFFVLTFAVELRPLWGAPTPADARHLEVCMPGPHFLSGGRKTPASASHGVPEPPKRVPLEVGLPYGVGHRLSELKVLIMFTIPGENRADSPQIEKRCITHTWATCPNLLRIRRFRRAHCFGPATALAIPCVLAVATRHTENEALRCTVRGETGADIMPTHHSPEVHVARAVCRW